MTEPDETGIDENDFVYDARMVELGRRMGRFLDTEEGEWLKAKAAQELAAARDALEAVCSHDQEILGLQSKAMAARLTMRWIQEAIDIGYQAEQNVTEQE